MITLLKLSPYAGDVAAPSPNYDSRESPAIEGIVLHATADMGEEALTVSWMRSPKSHVSCHLMVSRSGRVTRLVGDRQRAWHAGLSWWRGTSDVNSITLGIEIANRNDGEAYSDEQYRRVSEIVAHYCGQGLSLDDVVSHGAIAEGRKTDPLGWNWDRFRSMVQLQRQPMVVPPVAITPTSKPGAATMSVRAIAPNEPVPPKQRGAATVTAKPVLQSRTLWLNAMMVLAAGSLLVNDTLDLAHKVGIQLPEVVMKWVLFCVGVVNIILRLRTTQPLGCNQDQQHASPTPAMNSTARASYERRSSPRQGLKRTV